MPAGIPVAGEAAGMAAAANEQEAESRWLEEIGLNDRASGTAPHPLVWRGVNCGGRAGRADYLEGCPWKSPASRGCHYALI